MSSRRLRPFACILLTVLVWSCDENAPIERIEEPLPPIVETRLIADISYVKNVYFFLDDPNGPFIRPDLSTFGGIEVWQSVPDSLVGIENLNVKRGRAWLDRSARGDDIRQGLEDLDNGLNPAFVGPRNFKLMFFGSDFRYVLNDFDDSVIGIELVNVVPENEVLGVRYINVNGDTIGDIGNDIGTEQNPINLELIKNANQKPDDANFGPAWRYMMRHIYNLGLTNIDPTLEVHIVENTLRQDPSRPDGSGVPWLRIFGLDQTGVGGFGPPDDLIDLGRGLIDLQRGLLTFPILRAFDPPDDSVKVWTDSLFSFADPMYEGLRNPQIYDEFLSIPQDAQKFSIYVTHERRQ